ncbi:uncharacterized protein LOC144716231 [Wolffia australiana]
MTSLASLFDNPLLWKEAMADVTELFGELHFDPPSDPGVAPLSPPPSLHLCTESLGSESSDHPHVAAHRCATSHGISTSRFPSRRHPRPVPQIPPPLGKPRFRLRSFRSDGRFVITEEPIPCQEILRAHRRDGRLTLCFVPPAVGPGIAAGPEEEDDADG